MDRTVGTAVISISPPDAHVVAAGEFDLVTTPTLTTQLGDALAAGCQRFLIDLSGVSFCDASTVGVLVGLDRRLQGTGGSMRIATASAPVRRIFEIVGLSSMLEPSARPLSASS